MASCARRTGSLHASSSLRHIAFHRVVWQEEFESCLRRYAVGCEVTDGSRRGAIFFAVCRGKVSGFWFAPLGRRSLFFSVAQFTWFFLPWLSSLCSSVTNAPQPFVPPVSSPVALSSPPSLGFRGH